MSKRQLVPITPDVLRWTIRESGIDEVALADIIGVPPNELHDWQHGRSQPSKTQFKSLLEALKRPSAIFFLPEPPASLTPRVDFRRPKGSGRFKPTPKELKFLRVAGRVQRAIAWTLGETEAVLPTLLRVSTNEPVERAAKRIREFLIDQEEGASEAASDSQLQNLWRSRLEAKGVFVFFLPLGRESVLGFSLFDTAAPLIAINTTRWSARSRIFSMLHEFAHLASRTSSVCMDVSQRFLPRDGDRVERWCEMVAASVLMPWDEVARFLATNLRMRPGQKVSSLEQLYRIANNFGASARAAALRLIDHQHAEWSLYSQIPESKDEKRKAGGGGGRSRTEIREDEYGGKAIRIFARAVKEGLITSADASGYLRMADEEIQSWQ